MADASGPRRKVIGTAAPLAVLPTPLQRLLFRGALCEDGEFAACWRDLNQAMMDGAPDASLTPHLPLLHSRLTPEYNDALASAVRAAYRQTWAANQLLFAALRASLQALHAAGVHTLLLKGAAVLAAYYKDMGARSMSDFDLLVKEADFAKAVRTLTGLGWKPVHPEEGFDPRFAHALAMVDGRGNNLDLHVHVLHFTTAHDADALFWASAVAVTGQKLDTFGLCAADLVLHLAVHGLRWSPHPQLRWVPDIACVLRAEEIDWDRLLWMTEHLHASIAVSTVLEYLVHQDFARVPERVLSHLRAIAVGPRERELFDLSTRDTFSGLRSTARFHWHIMTQGEDAGPLHRKLGLLPAYLSHRMKTRAFGSWYDLLGAGLLRHLLAKAGRYERSPEGWRLR